MNSQRTVPPPAGGAGSRGPLLPQLELPVLTLVRAFKILMQCALVALLAYGSFLLVTRYVLQSVEIVGNSMSPTLENARRYVLNRWVYLMREPKPADIVVIRDPSDNSYAVKRIIAGNGDSIYLKAGRIYVNGRALAEPYLPPGTPTFANPCYREQWVVCGKNQFFVLGDNRNNSTDSRIYGPVPRQNILGVIIH